uniref:Uncharacterized protein n=1 Tax=Mesocestoides corti TaxID=53468 RepID=A0A5K3F6F9_MESCO
MKKTGTTKPALSTNHKPESHVRRLPSKSTTLAVAHYIFLSVSNWLPIFLAAETEDWLR